MSYTCDPFFLQNRQPPPPPPHTHTHTQHYASYCRLASGWRGRDLGPNCGRSVPQQSEKWGLWSKSSMKLQGSTACSSVQMWSSGAGSNMKWGVSAALELICRKRMAGTLASCIPGVLKKHFAFSSLSKWAVARGWRWKGFIQVHKFWKWWSPERQKL